MARDFEDIHDLEDLSDGELRDLVNERLSASNALDIDEITVRAASGRVTLEGRVGTDEERRIADHIVTDVLGIENLDNRLFVDPVRRAKTSDDPQEELVEEEREEGLLLGDKPRPISPEADHLVVDEDAELFGTTDVNKTIEGGTAWIPPESPTPEGPAERGEFGEDH